MAQCRVPTSGLVPKSLFLPSEFFPPSTSRSFVFYFYFPYSITLVFHFTATIHSFCTRDHFLSAYHHHQSLSSVPSSSLHLTSCLSLPALLPIHYILTSIQSSLTQCSEALISLRLVALSLFLPVTPPIDPDERFQKVSHSTTSSTHPYLLTTLVVPIASQIPHIAYLPV